MARHPCFTASFTKRGRARRDWFSMCRAWSARGDRPTAGRRAASRRRCSSLYGDLRAVDHLAVRPQRAAGRGRSRAAARSRRASRRRHRERDLRRRGLQPVVAIEEDQVVALARLPQHFQQSVPSGTPPADRAPAAASRPPAIAAGGMSARPRCRRFTSLMSTREQPALGRAPVHVREPRGEVHCRGAGLGADLQHARGPEQAYQIVEGPTVARVHPGLGRQVPRVSMRAESRPPVALQARWRT